MPFGVAIIATQHFILLLRKSIKFRQKCRECPRRLYFIVRSVVFPAPIVVDFPWFEAAKEEVADLLVSFDSGFS